VYAASQSENPKGREHLIDLAVDWRILQWLLKE
jgi:hypothetical protein